MADEVGGTEWLLAQRAAATPTAIDAVARKRMTMEYQNFMTLNRAVRPEVAPIPTPTGSASGYRGAPVIEPLPPPVGALPPPPPPVPQMPPSTDATTPLLSPPDHVHPWTLLYYDSLR